MVGNIGLDVFAHKGEVFQAFEQHKIDDGRERHTAEKTDFPRQTAFDVEGEDDTRDILHKRTHHKGNGDTQEDAHYHLKSL